MRRALVTALALCVDRKVRPKTRRFLMGLSCDELQFLAEFMGASILESDCQRPGSLAPVAERLVDFQKDKRARPAAAPDQDDKIILLVEFLTVSGFEPGSFAARAARN